MVCHSSACQTISVRSVYIKTKLTITGAVHITTCNEKTALTFKKKQNLLATFLSLKENFQNHQVSLIQWVETVLILEVLLFNAWFGDICELKVIFTLSSIE